MNRELRKFRTVVLDLIFSVARIMKISPEDLAKEVSSHDNIKYSLSLDKEARRIKDKLLDDFLKDLKITIKE